ncbi:MAG: tetratricopeptide repeat protein, partial [Terriglobales bacterium]
MTDTDTDSVWDHYYSMGRQAIQSGDYPGAETLWFAALQMVEFNGENDPRLFITLDNLAEACYCQNKIPQAKNLYWENVSIKEKYLGPDHIDLANNLKRLAAIYYRQDRFADAAQLGKRILGIYE